MEWSGKTFENLVRRYVPTSIDRTADGVRVHAELQYVWRESGEVADRSRVVIELGIREGMISSWVLEEEPS